MKKAECHIISMKNSSILFLTFSLLFSLCCFLCFSLVLLFFPSIFSRIVLSFRSSPPLSLFVDLSFFYSASSILYLLLFSFYCSLIFRFFSCLSVFSCLSFSHLPTYQYQPVSSYQYLTRKKKKSPRILCSVQVSCLGGASNYHLYESPYPPCPAALFC